MTEELSGEWFAEKWNMWLKGKLENHIQARLDTVYDKFI